MLRTAPPSGNEGVKTIVDRLVREDQLWDQNRRSAHRTPFVRPVLIHLPDREEPVRACSKNISSEGIGILTPAEIPLGTHAKLRIYGLRDQGPLMLAELRWSDAFGEHWTLTGWKLINEAR